MAKAEEQGKTEAAQTEDAQKEESLLDQIISEGRWREGEDKERALRYRNYGKDCAAQENELFND